MRHAAGVHVVAIGRPVGAHAGKPRRKHAEQRELPPGETLGDEHGEISALPPRRAHDAVLVGGGNMHDARQRSERRLEVLAEGRHDDDAEILLVLGDDPADAVVDRRRAPAPRAASVMRFSSDSSAVFRGVEDLQLAQAPEQEPEQARLRRADQDRAAREAAAKLQRDIARLIVARLLHVHLP